MKKILLLLIVLPTILFGQTSHATFSADTTRFSNERNGRMDIFEKIMEAEWKINGQTLSYGSDPIHVQTDVILDTIFYKQSKNASWDTLICSINQPKNYMFYYNECCGGFNVADETGGFVSGTVQFEVQHSNKKKHYLGTLGEAGVFVVKKSETLNSTCRSAMSPNIYQITFKEIELCKDPITCPEEICLVEAGKEEPNYGFGFSTMSKFIDFLFLPLSSDPIQVCYDLKSGKVSIK